MRDTIPNRFLLGIIAAIFAWALVYTLRAVLMFFF